MLTSKQCSAEKKNSKKIAALVQQERQSGTAEYNALSLDNSISLRSIINMKLHCMTKRAIEICIYNVQAIMFCLRCT